MAIAVLPDGTKLFSSGNDAMEVLLSGISDEERTLFDEIETKFFKGKLNKLSLKRSVAHDALAGSGSYEFKQAVALRFGQYQFASKWIWRYGSEMVMMCQLKDAPFHSRDAKQFALNPLLSETLVKRLFSDGFITKSGTLDILMLFLPDSIVSLDFLKWIVETGFNEGGVGKHSVSDEVLGERAKVFFDADEVPPIWVAKLLLEA
jgi:hypothetical protein